MEREFFPEFYFGGISNNNNEAMKSTGKKLHTKEPHHQFVDFDFTTAKQKEPNFVGTGTHDREENVTVVNFSSHMMIPTRSSVNFTDGNLGSDLGESSTSMNSLGFQEKEVFFEKDQQGKRNKRKGKGASELHSGSKRVEDHEENGSHARKLNPRTSSRRSRSAEMHNLSERRRRDKINEKLKALQELLPHCTKTDKASMLDEAIEYLKSLQIQLQMMWIESGMAPMIFPDTHHQYMSITAVDHHHHPHHHHDHHDHENPPRITRPLFDDQSKLRDLNANLQPNSPPRQTENENLYLHKFSPQGTNQRGFGARTVQEPHFGDGMAIDRNTFL